MAATIVSFVPCAAVGQDQKQPLRLFLGNKAIPPFVSLQDGKPVGIVVDLAYALADKAGLNIIVEAMDWPTAQSEVLHGKADALLQINPNPERERVYDFSDPVLEFRFQIFRKVTRIDIQSLASLRGMRVGVESGGFPAQQLGGGGEFQLVLMPTWKAAFILLNAGQVDAVIVDRWVGEYELAINRFEGVTVVDPPVAQNYSRIAVGKGNKELLDKINLGLKSIRQDGTYQGIMDKWQLQGVVYFTKQFIDKLVFYTIVVCGALIIGDAIIIYNASARKKRLATLERRVKERTQELEAHKASLEDTVDARTRELANSNERLVAAYAEMESFSYSVSHDLRTPLRAIDGFSNILLRDYSEKLDAEGKRLLQVVRDGAIKMGQLIEDILAFSRVSRQELAVSDIDMGSLVQDTLRELAPAMADRAIEMKVGALPRVVGDPRMLQRVWTNLLDNAIKYTGPKPDTVIEVGARAEGGETVFFVKDNGVGFNMQYADKLFGLFQRLHGTEQFLGTGIGLAIVKRIVTRHGGRVWAESKVGEGATFYFALPQAHDGHA